MGIGKVVVDANHAVILAGISFVGGNQFAGSIPILWPVRRRQHIKKLLYAGIDWDGDTSVGSSVAASGRISSGGEQSSMGKGIRYGSNCRGCLYFTKPLIVDKE